MSSLSDRRFLAFCFLSALLGVPTAIYLFPNEGIMVLVVPIVILSISMFVDGYANST
jgi:hypothetical protein